MENYYEILEVSENASNEVIEKAHKVLVKKYHPDLQEYQNKEYAEEKMKKINDAYEILSDEQKRAEYDRKLAIDRQNIIENLKKESIEQKGYTDYEKTKNQQKINEDYNNNYLRSIVCRVKEKWTWKKFLNFIKAIVIMAMIITILWFFPPTNKWMVEFYEGNPILKGICNIIGKTVETIWIAICSLFEHPPKI